MEYARSGEKAIWIPIRQIAYCRRPRDVKSSHWWALRGARELAGFRHVPFLSRPALVPCTGSAQPEGPHSHWEQMRRLIEQRLPPARIRHPYPLQCFGIITQARAQCGVVPLAGIRRGSYG